jgi:hypothetical protein
MDAYSVLCSLCATVLLAALVWPLSANRSALGRRLGGRSAESTAAHLLRKAGFRRVACRVRLLELRRHGRWR